MEKLKIRQGIVKSVQSGPKTSTAAFTPDASERTMNPNERF